MDITQDIIRKLFEYSPDTGAFTWKVSPARRVKAGDVAGSINKTHGYIYLKVNNKTYAAHRLAFLYMTGSQPEMVDHINGDGLDNRWCNLRSATASQNSWNRRSKIKGSSGVKGVFWVQDRKKWRVILVSNRRRIHLGYFSDLDSAEHAAKTARRKYHKEFANHG